MGNTLSKALTTKHSQKGKYVCQVVFMRGTDKEIILHEGTLTDSFGKAAEEGREWLNKHRCSTRQISVLVVPKYV